MDRSHHRDQTEPLGFRRRCRGGLWTPALLALVGCSDPATQLVVVVDTDYEVPRELGFVRVVVRDEGGRATDSLERALIARDARAAAGEATVPHSFGVVPRDNDAERRVIVEVQGFDAPNGQLKVVRRAVTGFVARESLLLSMFLAKGCEGVWETCGDGETCTENGCESDQRPPGSLHGVEPGRELPFRGDAGTPDGQPTGQDGGLPGADGADVADTDAGLPARDCGIDLGDPRLVATLSLPHDVDKDLLVGDVDGDGAEELVASRGGAGTSAFSVIDFEECARPVVTSTTVFELKQEPVLVRPQGEATLWVAERRGIRAWRYREALSPPLARITTVLATEDLSHVSVSPDLRRAMAAVRTSDWGFAAFEVDSGRVSVDLRSERIRSVLAFVHARGVFVGGGDLTMQVLEEARPSLSVGSVPRAEDPVAVSFEDERAVVLMRSGPTLHVLKLDLGSGATTSTRSATVFAADIESEPVLVRAGEDVRAFLLLSDGTVTWCDLEEGEGLSPASCLPGDLSESFSIPSDQVEPGVGLLTAYVNADGEPDIVLVTRGGLVHFLDGLRIRDPAAPSLDLGRDTRRVAGIAVGFWDRHVAPGDLLAVQHTGGAISLIGWRRPSGAGSTNRLWPQHHRDPQRSGLLP